MRRMLVLLQLVGIGLIAASLSSTADTMRSYLGTQSCDQLNAAAISIATGTQYYSNCSGHVGSKCVYCVINGPPPSNQLMGGANGPNPQGYSNPISSTCGDLWVGTCVVRDGVAQCEDDDGNSNGTCANAVSYPLQSQ